MNQYGNDGLFSSWCWESDSLYGDPYLIANTKMDSRWLKDLNMKVQTMNIIEEERVEEYVFDLGRGKDHLLQINKKKMPTHQEMGPVSKEVIF